MVQLKILSGKKAGTEMAARRFPFHIGRAATCDLPLDDPGIWDKHFKIDFDSTEGFLLVSDVNTSVIIEGKTVQQTALRNGDVIGIGTAKILFSFSPTRQKSLAFRESLTWIALAGLCLAQIALIYRFLR